MGVEPWEAGEMGPREQTLLPRKPVRGRHLGGDAPTVHARAPDVVALADGHLEPAVHGMQGRSVTAHAAPDDQDVVVVLAVLQGDTQAHRSSTWQ